MIISGGMWRSGSTFLFNILRETLLMTGNSVASGLATEEVLNSDAGYRLVKLHYLRPHFLEKASYVFYTYRDVRTAMVSTYRKFGWPIQLCDIRENIENYYVAKELGMLIEYKDLIKDPEWITRKILNVFGWSYFNAKEITRRALSWHPPMGKDLDPISLLHPGHFTYTKDEDWRYVIPIEMQKEINREFRSWFLECRYPTE